MQGRLPARETFLPPISAKIRGEETKRGRKKPFGPLSAPFRTSPARGLQERQAAREDAPVGLDPQEMHALAQALDAVQVVDRPGLAARAEHLAAVGPDQGHLVAPFLE